MTGTGQFHRSGGQLFTTYDATSEGCSQLINDFYDGAYSVFYSGFARSAGTPVFDNGFGFSGGMFNPKYGMDTTVSMFTSKTVSAAIPKRAYDHEGMRLLMKFATYGQAKDFVNRATGQPLYTTGNPNRFLGLGAATPHDGRLPGSVKMDYDMIRIPYKELPLPYDFGLGLKALESKGDDTASYKQYIDFIGQNYSDLTDKTILRPLSDAQPTAPSDDVYTNAGDGYAPQETSLNGLARIFSSGTELAVGDNASKVLPWGGLDGDMAGNVTTHTLRSGAGRCKNVTWDTDGIVTANTHKAGNYDAQVVDADEAIPSLGLFNDLYTKCMVNWEGDFSQKAWIMSPGMWDKLSQLCIANNVYIDSLYTSTSIGGMKTVEGRDVGMMVNSYRNQPILMTGNLSFDYENQTVDTSIYGDVFMLDLKHIWMCMTSPVEVWTCDNPVINAALVEQSLTTMRAELRADKFISSGRLTNVGASA